MTMIELPWPPRQLMPNFKRANHWSKYRKQEKAAGMLGFGLTAEQCGLRSMAGASGDIEIRITAVPPMRPGPLPDEDNFKGALKHYLDGIARGLGVNDRQFRFERIKWEPKAGGGKVIVSF